jgi:hypothetical protein
VRVSYGPHASQLVAFAKRRANERIQCRSEHKTNRRHRSHWLAAVSEGRPRALRSRSRPTRAAARPLYWLVEACTASGYRVYSEAMSTEVLGLIQSAMWPSVVLLGTFILRRSIVSLLDALRRRLEEGSGVKVGEVFALTERSLVTQTKDLPKSPDVQIVGNPDQFKLLFKARTTQFMKSTKAMEVAGGCVLQVTTERYSPDGSTSVAEALSFVPDVTVQPDLKTGSGHILQPRAGVLK